MYAPGIRRAALIADISSADAEDLIHDAWDEASSAEKGSWKTRASEALADSKLSTQADPPAAMAGVKRAATSHPGELASDSRGNLDASKKKRKPAASTRSRGGRHNTHADDAADDDLGEALPLPEDPRKETLSRVGEA